MLQQNTVEWENIRKEKIGASDAPIIMGESPYKTPHKLWQEKVGIAESRINFAMKKGHTLEPLARTAFEEMTGLLVQPQVKFHKNIDWMMASLDAVDISGKAIAEIKCPGQVDHQLAISGKIPPKYYAQLQHQMEVCEVEEVYYFSFDGENGVLLREYRNETYIKKMLKVEEAFYEQMLSLEAPILTERDFITNYTPEWLEAAREWKMAKLLLEDVEKSEESARKKLISLCDNSNMQGAGIRLSKCARKGNIEYSKIPELKDINLDIYRKDPSSYWKIANVAIA